MAYSVTCAALRTKRWACATASGEIAGFSQRKNGVKKREVCSADIKSVEPKNISVIQRTTGSQDLVISPIFKPGA